MFFKVVMFSLISGISLYASPSQGILLQKATFEEKIVLNSFGQKVQTMIPVKTVQQGGTLVYVNRLVSQASVEKRNIVVNNPIPPQTVYLRGSATCEGLCRMLFSIDGGRSFKNVQDLHVGYGVNKRAAFGSEYTHIKFIFNSIMPFSQTRMAFKAVVK